MVFQWQVGEAQLVDLLEKFSQHTQKKTTIKVNNIIIHLHRSIVKKFFLLILCSLRGRDWVAMMMTSKFPKI